MKWISKSSIEQVERLYKLISDGRIAEGYIEQDTNIPVFHFIKEGNSWKFALSNSFVLANQAFLGIAKQPHYEKPIHLIISSRISFNFQMSQ